MVPLFLTHCKHTKKDIPKIIEETKKQVANTEIEYTEPLIEQIAEIIAEKIRKNIKKRSKSET